MTLTRAILTELKTIPEPLLASEQMIHVSINVTLPEPVTLQDVRDELVRMATKDLVVGSRNDIDRVTRWKLTPEGRLA